MNAKYCPKCVESKQNYGNIFSGYYGSRLKAPSNNKCLFCSSELKESILSEDELIILSKISSDDTFLQAMIKLKESDQIEYQLKLSQFKATVTQQESAKSDNRPKCPHCKSTNIKSISGLNRGASIAMWGIFSKKINKSFECMNCKYTW